MNYLSVCSGIEAATVAWHPLGWQPVGFAEIEAFPSAVLAHHYGSNLPGEALSRNGVPNFGDLRKFKEWPLERINLLVGGTPCQSFSVAGLRRGLADPRGNLCLTYLGVADLYQPEWLLWENVPGVLSSNRGRDFGSFLGALSELGYGWAYRVLDAQYIRVDGFGRAVPQRRRRVFVVGCLGDQQRAASVLFEPESLSGNPAPRREPGQNVAPTISARPTGGGGLGTDFDLDGGLLAFGGNDTSGPIDVATARNAHSGPYGRLDFESETFIAFTCKDHGGDAEFNLSPTLRAGGFTSSHANAGVMPAVAFDMRGREGGSQFEGPHHTANIRAASGGSSRSYVAERWAVRRLMPIECERLQGFEDDYTNIMKRSRPAADGPRYKALGNSMAVNVMRWLGRRIERSNRLAVAA